MEVALILLLLAIILPIFLVKTAIDVVGLLFSHAGLILLVLLFLLFMAIG